MRSTVRYKALSCIGLSVPTPASPAPLQLFAGVISDKYSIIALYKTFSKIFLKRCEDYFESGRSSRKLRIHERNLGCFAIQRQKPLHRRKAKHLRRAKERQANAKVSSGFLQCVSLIRLIRRFVLRSGSKATLWIRQSIRCCEKTAYEASYDFVFSLSSGKNIACF